MYRFADNLQVDLESAVHIYERFQWFSYEQETGDLSTTHHRRLADHCEYHDPERLWNALHVDYMVDGHIIDWDINAGYAILRRRWERERKAAWRASLKSEVKVERLEEEMVMAEVAVGHEVGHEVGHASDIPREKVPQTLPREKRVIPTTSSSPGIPDSDLPLPSTPCSPSPPLPSSFGMTLLNEDPEAIPFSEFWALYPKKTERFRAERLWAQMLPSERQAALDVVKKMQRCIKAHKAPQVKYMNGGAIWLHQKRWMDWIDGAPFGWDDRSVDNCSSTFQAFRSVYQMAVEAESESQACDRRSDLGQLGVSGSLRQIERS